MFQQYTDYFMIALFFAIVFYSIWVWLRAPFLVRKFYRTLGFVDHRESVFDQLPFSQSLLLKQHRASNVYAGEYKGHQMAQFAAFPEDRYKFTLSKAKRKQNQVLWTVTVLTTDQPGVKFCARPATVTNALEYVLDRDCVEFPDDEMFTNKVHILSDDHLAVRRCFTPAVREYLTRLDPLSLESLGSTLILRAPRQPHDVGSQLKSELDALIFIHEEMRSSKG